MPGETIRGRGSADNPPNRFQRLTVLADPDAAPEDRPNPKTQFFRDSSRGIIATNDSPDIPFQASLNPYRGCEHGCIYCYARPTHEYLGFSAGLDFETKIMVKEDAPELLRRHLASRNWRAQPVAISGVTDPYQPIERKLKLTRRCIEVFADFKNPISIVTKNHLVTRDADLLGQMAQKGLAMVYLSITTLDPDLTCIMEPRTAAPKRRLDAIRTLSRAGVPVGVLVAPVIPALTDHEMPAILSAAAEAGATQAGFQIVRLPLAVADLFEDWLQRHRPERSQKVLARLKDMRQGRLNSAQFGQRMRGTGQFADQIRQMFTLTCRKTRLNEQQRPLRTDLLRREPQQPTLF